MRGRCHPAGWFNLLGQVAVTAAIAFTLTNHLAAMVLLGGGGLGSGYQFTSAQLLGVYGGVPWQPCSLTAPLTGPQQCLESLS